MREKPIEQSLCLRILSTILVLGLILTIMGVFSTSFSSTKAAPANVYSEWRLVIDGAVGNPQSLSLNDLAAMPREEVHGVIYCGISMVASGNWGGVRISHLLEFAQVDISASNLEFRADDGYAINVAVEAALQQEFIIAYELDGQALPEVLRLALPGYPGNYWISTITKITLTTSTNYNIGPNYYTAQLGGGHPEPEPTPKPTLTPKSTPFRLPTPPLPQPTPTTQPIQTPSLTESTYLTISPSSTPSQQEYQISDTPITPLFYEPQEPDFSTDSRFLSNCIYPIAAAVFVILTVGVVVLRRRQNLRLGT